MSDSRFFSQTLLPSETSLDNMSEVLSDPANLNFPRLAARLLEESDSLDELRNHVDLQLLAQEFDKVKPYLSHGNLDESNRTYWEQALEDFTDELKPSDNSRNKPTSTSKTVDSPDQSPKTSEPQTASDPSINFETTDSGDFRDIGHTLAKARKQRGLSRNEVSDRCDLSLQEISDLESGRSEPTHSTLQELAEGLDRQLVIDFQDPDHGRKHLVDQAYKYVRAVLQEQGLDNLIERLCSITLHQLLLDILQRKTVHSVPELLEKLDNSTREFSLRDEEQSDRNFTNRELFNLIKQLIDRTDHSLMAFDEKISIVAQKAREQVQEDQLID